MHQLYRWGEPGENPYLGFLASADAIVVTYRGGEEMGPATASLLNIGRGLVASYEAIPFDVHLAGRPAHRLSRQILQASYSRQSERP